MQCPTCLMELPKRYWRPSQWWGSENVQYHQCKICDGEMPRPYWMNHNPAPAPAPDPAPAPERAPARAPTVRPMPETSPDVPKEAFDLIELLIHFRSDTCSNFVYKWMELPRGVRKEYSYHGAIKCRWAADPKHYTCPRANQSYFDPSNWVYAVAMRLMMPKMMKEVEWNIDTKRRHL